MICLSEVYVEGEQYCFVRDLLEEYAPPCNRCRYLRFCEKPRSQDDIEVMMLKVMRDAFRAKYFEEMEEDGYYDE